MQSTLKITSLVAVLGLCLAALTGSAYAYTATYVDTIDAQPIEDVYLVVSGVDTVRPTDVDVEYDTINDFVTDYTGYTDDKLFYKVKDVVVTGGKYAAKDVDGNVAYVCILVDTVSVKAYGDNAQISKFEATATVAGDATHGASAFLYVSDAELGADADVKTLSETKTITYDTPVSLAVNATKEFYTYLVIEVEQLNDKACKYSGYESFYNAAKIGNVTIPKFDIAYTATAAQTTA